MITEFIAICSCCVDEVAAQHYNADFLVHFGPACLAPVDNLPVRFVFGHVGLDIDAFVKAISESFSDNDAVTIVCEQVKWSALYVHNSRISKLCAGGSAIRLRYRS